jgi:hypothetical protein
MIFSSALIEFCRYRSEYKSKQNKIKHRMKRSGKSLKKRREEKRREERSRRE